VGQLEGITVFIRLQFENLATKLTKNLSCCPAAHGENN
jgi:hypothetical protein